MRWQTSVLVALGLLVSGLGGALLMAFHAPLYSHVRGSWLAATPVAGRTIYHFVTEDCRCSERLLEHLSSRAARRDQHETVVWMGKRHNLLNDLVALGYDVKTEKDVEQTGVLAAPWLLVRESNGAVAYSGGYEPAPHWESRILFHVDHRMRQAALPTTGCATSRAMRAESLILRLKDYFKNL